MTSHEYQSHDSLERRRRQIEKAKAAHLSRQLQTRLQYARLKVDHGWQKQTLNEVENLYFHHYRARLPPRKTQKAARCTENTQDGLSPTLQTVPANVETSLSQIRHSRPQQHPHPQPAVPDSQSSTIIPTDEDGTYEMDVDYNPDVQESSSVILPASPVTAAEPPTHSPAPLTITPPTPQITSASLSLPPPSPVVPGPTVQQPSKPSISPSPLPPPRPESQSTSKTTYTGTLPSNAKPLPIVPPPPVRKLPIPRLPSVAYGTATLPRSRPRPQPPRPTFSPSPSSSGLGSANAALTYDSFWSSHSAVPTSSITSSSNSYRSAQTSAPYPSLGRAGGGVSLASLPARYSFMGTTNSTFPISQGQGVPRKLATVPTATAAAGMHGGTGAD